jgi:murein tripeptide amidase MpaA
VHADEWGGPDILVNLAADLLEAYTRNRGLEYGGATFSASVIRSIVDRTDIVVFPLVNPDGYAYSLGASEGTDRANWRKNRNPASSGGDAEKIGVDVNRNYDFLWNFIFKFAREANVHTSADPRDGQFYGTGPFSEAESQNVQWLVDQFPNARYFVDIHSFSGKIMYPWGDDQSQFGDRFMSFWNTYWDGKRGLPEYWDNDQYKEYVPFPRLSELQTAARVIHDGIYQVRGEDYEVGDGFSILYPVSGSSKDWAFSREFVNPNLGRLNSFVIEFNKKLDPFPDWNEMLDLIADIDSGLIALCEHATPRSLDVLWCSLKRLIQIAADTVGRFLRR